MYIRVVYTAKIGTDRQTREVGIHTNSNGDMNLTFDKDIDWGAPVFMIMEPAEALEELRSVTDAPEVVDEPITKLDEFLEDRKEIQDWHMKRKIDAERKRPFVNYGDEMREKLKKREEK